MYREQVQLWLRLGQLVVKLFGQVDSKFQTDPVNWAFYTNKIADIRDKRLVKNTNDVGFIDCSKDLNAAEKELNNIEIALAI